MGAAQEPPESPGEPVHLLCPITHIMFRDPVVVAASGQTYERWAILEHWRRRGRAHDPMTNMEVKCFGLKTDWGKRLEVADFLQRHAAYVPDGWPDRLMPQPSSGPSLRLWVLQTCSWWTSALTTWPQCLSFLIAGVALALCCEWALARLFGFPDGSSYIDKLIFVLRTNPGSAWVQRNACAGLANLAFNDDHRSASIVRSGVVGAVIDAMRRHRSHVELQANACALLANLAHNSPERSLAIVEGGAVTEIVEAFKHHYRSPSATRNACAALEQMALQLPEQRSSPPMSTEVLTVLMEVLDHYLLEDASGDASMLRATCASLEALTVGGPSNSNAAEVVRIGGVRRIIRALRRAPHDMLLQGHCASALANVVSASDPSGPNDHAEHVVDVGGIGTLVAATRAYPGDTWVQGHALRALAPLLRVPAAAADEVLDSSGGTGRPGAVGTLALSSLLRHFDDLWVRGHACKVLEEIASAGLEGGRGPLQAHMSMTGLATACDAIAA